MKYQRFSDGAMRTGYPHRFGPADLEPFAAFLRTAEVGPLRENPAIAVRHDVDHNLDHALLFAEWEAAQGFRTSYYVLPTAWYWADEPAVRRNLERLVDLGHEVGIHQDTVAEAWRRGYRSPLDGSVLPVGDCSAAADILAEQIAQLRGWGFEITGSATHGTYLWATEHVTNAFLWAAGYRPEDFGLRYEAYHLHRFATYISDNRGQWQSPLRVVAGKPTHILTHPAHWDLGNGSISNERAFDHGGLVR